MQLFVNFYYSFYQYSNLILGIVELVIGIIIAAGKTKPTKVLGISYIISSLILMAESALKILISFVPIEVYANINEVVVCAVIVLSLGSLLCLCIYIHKNYGKKLVYIPAFLIAIGVRFIPVIANQFIRQMEFENDHYGMTVSIISQITSYASSLPLALFLLIVFAVNRNKEKIIPSVWKCMLIEMIVSFVQFFSSIVVNRMMTTAYSAGERIFVMSQMVFYMIAVQIILLTPIYVLIKSKKAARADADAALTDQVN